MAPRQSYENIFQTGLPRGQAQKLTFLPFDFIEQSGDRQVKFLHVEGYQAIVLACRFNARQLAPRFQRRAIRISSHRKLDNVMSAQAFDQIWWRTLRNDLTVVHDREPVTQSLRLVHIVSSQQDGAALALECPNDIP